MPPHAADQRRLHVVAIGRDVGAQLALSQDGKAVAPGDVDVRLDPLLLLGIHHRTQIEVLRRGADRKARKRRARSAVKLS